MQIKFYCLQNRGSGASLMAKAAIGSHAAALYSLAIIQFNGSGGCKNDKDLRAGVALCARSAFLGHVDALRELGHCLQDGYGVRKNVDGGRRFLLQANALELAAGASQSSLSSESESLFSDFGCNVPTSETHPANRFLIEWFGSRGLAGPELRLCSHAECGRPETRKHEFRRCSVCGNVNYCSRACQALHWKLGHKDECAPPDQAEEMQDDDDDDDADASEATAGGEGGADNDEEAAAPAVT